MTKTTPGRKHGESVDGPLHFAIAFRNRHGEGVWDAIQRLLNAVDCSYSRALRDVQKHPIAAAILSHNRVSSPVFFPAIRPQCAHASP